MDCYEYSSAIPTIRAALVAGVVGLAEGPLTPASSQKENVGQSRPQGGGGRAGAASRPAPSVTVARPSPCRRALQGRRPLATWGRRDRQ